jgi:hypothetical protein
MSNEQEEISRRAIVIGINTYPGLPPKRQLKGAENDALEIADRLEKDGKFVVEKLIGYNEATYLKIRTALSKVFYKEAKRYDIVLLFYAGHGIIDGHGNLYLASSDMQEDDPFVNGIDTNYIDKVISLYIEMYRNEVPVLILLDCCHSGIAAGEVSRSRSLTSSSSGTSEITNTDFISSVQKSFGEGKYYFTSSAAAQVSKELSLPHAFRPTEKHDHGAFSYHLIEALDGGAADEKGEVSFLNVIKYMENKPDKEKLGQKFTSKITRGANISKIRILTSSEL